MNKERRKGLNSIIKAIELAKEELENLKAEEEEYRDNMPENLCGSEKYERAEEICESLDEAIYDLEEAVEKITEAIE